MLVEATDTPHCSAAAAATAAAPQGDDLPQSAAAAAADTGQSPLELAACQSCPITAHPSIVLLAEWLCVCVDVGGCSARNASRPSHCALLLCCSCIASSCHFRLTSNSHAPTCCVLSVVAMFQHDGSATSWCAGLCEHGAAARPHCGLRRTQEAPRSQCTQSRLQCIHDLYGHRTREEMGRSGRAGGNTNAREEGGV